MQDGTRAPTGMELRIYVHTDKKLEKWRTILTEGILRGIKQIYALHTIHSQKTPAIRLKPELDDYATQMAEKWRQLDDGTTDLSAASSLRRCQRSMT